MKVVEDETHEVWRPTSRTTLKVVGGLARLLKTPMSAVNEGEGDDEDEESTAMDTDGGAPGAAVSTPVAAPPSDDVDVTSSGSLPADAQKSDRPKKDEMAIRSYAMMKGAKADVEPFIRVFDIQEARNADVTCIWVNIVMFERWGYQMYQKPTKNSIAFFNEHHDTVARFTPETFTGLSPVCFDPLDTTHQVSNARFAEVRDTWTLKFYRALTALLQLDNPEFANSLGSLEEYDIDILLVLYEVCRQSLAANPYGTLSAAHYRFLLTANVPTQEREALCVAQATQEKTTEDVLFPEHVFSTAEPPVQANTNEGNVLLLGDSGFCYKKKKGFHGAF